MGKAMVVGVTGAVVSFTDGREGRRPTPGRGRGDPLDSLPSDPQWRAPPPLRHAPLPSPYPLWVSGERGPVGFLEAGELLKLGQSFH